MIEKSLSEQALLKAINLCRQHAPKVHCLTNQVSMQDVANLMLAMGGSAIMAQASEEAAEIAEAADAVLLNTGVPDEAKWNAFALAGKAASKQGKPLVLDPVGAGASRYRKEGLRQLLQAVKVTLIRCNQEEACALLELAAEQDVTEHKAWQQEAASLDGFENGTAFRTAGKIRNGTEKKAEEESRKKANSAYSLQNGKEGQETLRSGGVESSIALSEQALERTARNLANAYDAVVFISGKTDMISDGTQLCAVEGGDSRMRRITGGGCMLSALCAFFAGTGLSAFEAALAASLFWRKTAQIAGKMAEQAQRGIGTFHTALFDAAETICQSSAENSRETCMHPIAEKACGAKGVTGTADA